PITITEPNGGETYPQGASRKIRWVSGGGPRRAGMKIQLFKSDDPSFKVDLTSGGAAPDTGQFTWTVPNLIGRTFRIRVTNAADPADFDESDADFIITDGTSDQICTPQVNLAIPDFSAAWTESPLAY